MKTLRETAISADEELIAPMSVVALQRCVCGNGSDNTDEQREFWCRLTITAPEP